MTAKKENSGMLQGMKCPGCGSLGPFRIDACASFDIGDDGVQGYEGVHWNNDSECYCHSCEWSSNVSVFIHEAMRIVEMYCCFENGMWNAGYFTHVPVETPEENVEKTAIETFWPKAPSNAVVVGVYSQANEEE